MSLGVSTVAALLGRRRVLGLLRLVGMPAATLRTMVSYETMLPAATALVMSIGLGWLTAWSLVGGVSGRHISWPDGSYWLVLGACLCWWWWQPRPAPATAAGCWPTPPSDSSSSGSVRICHKGT